MKKYFTVCAGALLTIGMSGCGDPSLDEIKEKIVKVETRNASYTAVNKKTGAYGKYQILPSTGRFYAKKLNIPVSQWRTPENQERIFEALLQDNIEQLKKQGLDVDAFTVYGCHQQGASGFVCIMKNENLTKKFHIKLRRNLPPQYRNVDPNDLRKTWINYWKNKMEEV